MRLWSARSWRARARGLAGHSLADCAGIDGMIFQFPFAARWPVWMRGMQFSIDLIWLYGDVVLAVQSHIDQKNPWRCYFPPRSATGLIERIIR